MPKMITAMITRIGVIIFRPRLMTIGLIDNLALVLVTGNSQGLLRRALGFYIASRR
ncbi:hypothetical protein [Varibaculum cambriense]|uniref:hypothetical protein n=1 Tax=Varibaculum cambriense TaxID=184870 RepID=UPI00290BCAD8|nr:hypothetical protein [Varibaculum cambriense]MDU5541277.1 hypothetical protein [Varibaculum cambriense]